MLYTRKGDDGTSGILGTKARFPKNSPIYEALGTLDELNSLLGVCRAHFHFKKGDVDVVNEIKNVQECLFIIQAELAGAPKSVLQKHISGLERVIEKIETISGNPHSFLIPGSTKTSALLDYARSVSRRAERRVLNAHLVRKVSFPTRKGIQQTRKTVEICARWKRHFSNARISQPSFESVVCPCALEKTLFALNAHSKPCVQLCATQTGHNQAKPRSW